MPKREDTRHSILCVSASEKFDAIVRKSLTGFLMVDSRKSAATARRCILERYYDIVVVNAPLPDESGEQFAIDVTQACSASVLLVVPSEVYQDVLEHVTDHGVLVVSKPLQTGLLFKAIRLLAAIQSRMHVLERQVEAAHEKLEEMRLVSKAKFLLVEQEHMTEDEAHRYIGKQAMDHGLSRKRIAEQLIEDYE
jgi:response regulator NasT